VTPGANNENAIRCRRVAFRDQFGSRAGYAAPILLE
jgi:hypothetical protein